MKDIRAIKNFWDSETEILHLENAELKVPIAKAQDLVEKGVAVELIAEAKDEKVEVVDSKEKVIISDKNEKKVINDK